MFFFWFSQTISNQFCQVKKRKVHIYIESDFGIGNECELYFSVIFRTKLTKRSQMHGPYIPTCIQNENVCCTQTRNVRCTNTVVQVCVCRATTEIEKKVRKKKAERVSERVSEKRMRN